jgi:hypothetical protein
LPSWKWSFFLPLCPSFYTLIFHISSLHNPMSTEKSPTWGRVWW